MEPRHHFGVYARIVEAGRILLVRKTRGPYAGLLDLPGGSPESGESWSQTLERELHEELGLTVTVTGSFKPFSLHVQTSSTGTTIDFRHHGAVLDLPPPADTIRPWRSPDTDGAEWFDLHTDDRSRLSAAALGVLPLSRWSSWRGSRRRDARGSGVW
jgi:8-oxo-dGTP pyrophosphatase MutT (NUDIX family)